MYTILAAIWFFMPAGIGNAAPIFAARLPWLRRLDAPIDLGMSWRGARLLGDHKTWRGLVAGVALATLTLWIEQLLIRNVPLFEPFVAIVPGFTALPLFILGPLLGLGALLGDAVESFFKRRRGTQPGETWFPLDQIDYILGAIVASLVVVRLSLGVYIAAIVLWPAVHIVSSYVGYLFRLKDSPI